MTNYSDEWARDIERRVIVLEKDAAVNQVSKAHMDAKFDELKDKMQSISDSLQASQRWLIGIIATPLVGAIILFIVRGGLHNIPGAN